MRVMIIAILGLLPLSVLSQGFEYGEAADQNKALHIEHLHKQGYTGEGVTIAVPDAGFKGVKSLDVFSHLQPDQLQATRNYLTDTSSNVYQYSSHGTFVLSQMAAVDSGRFIGVAPDANYLLAATDNIDSEPKQDERNLVSAFKWAYNSGADIIQASLSYYDFDPGFEDYDYQDRDGETALSSQAADRWADSGMVIVTIAGNNAKVKVPCVADSVLCVGGTGLKKQYDDSSSVGPTVDGRLKPDVAAPAQNVAGYFDIGFYEFNTYAGTSYASPLVTGLVACLQEKYPKATNAQLMRSIRQSSTQAQNPDTLIGHGVPDARVADSLLGKMMNTSSQQLKAPGSAISIYPNPVRKQLTIEFSGETQINSLSVISSTGQTVRQLSIEDRRGQLRLNTNDLKPGIYSIRLQDANGKVNTKRFVKH